MALSEDEGLTKADYLVGERTSESTPTREKGRAERVGLKLGDTFRSLEGSPVLYLRVRRKECLFGREGEGVSFASGTAIFFCGGQGLLWGWGGAQRGKRFIGLS